MDANTENPERSRIVGKDGQPDCPHNALRKKRGNYTFDCYVCGNCAALFEVELHVEPPPGPKEPMFDRRPPWGFRSRQA
jgi:hypothetical protein